MASVCTVSLGSARACRRAVGEPGLENGPARHLRALVTNEHNRPFGTGTEVAPADACGKLGDGAGLRCTRVWLRSTGVLVGGRLAPVSSLDIRPLGRGLGAARPGARLGHEGCY